MAKSREGIEVIHSRVCRSRRTTRQSCTCPAGPHYRAQVWDPRLKVLHRSEVFHNLAEATGWRDDQKRKVRLNQTSGKSTITIKEAGEALLAGMRAGAILNRSGRRYKPSTIRTYEKSLLNKIYPVIGDVKLQKLTAAQVQQLVETLNGSGLSGSSVLNNLDPLRVICKRAKSDHVIAVNPCEDRRLPRPAGPRERVEPPAVALKLIAALPERLRALWAMALFAGLRRGELRALRWIDIDLNKNLVTVNHGWDDREGMQETKSRKTRTVVLAGVVRKELLRHKLATGRDGNDLVFGTTATTSFDPSTMRKQAHSAWEKAGLKPLSVHEARHCAVSYFIAAGWNPKQIQTAVGHSDIRTTFNQYGHLMPEDWDGKRDQLDTFLGTGDSNPATVDPDSKDGRDDDEGMPGVTAIRP